MRSLFEFFIVPGKRACKLCRCAGCPPGEALWVKEGRIAEHFCWYCLPAFRLGRKGSNLGFVDIVCGSEQHLFPVLFGASGLLVQGSVRWVPFIGQPGPLTSLTPDGYERIQSHHRPHMEFCLPVHCGALHGSTSIGNGRG